jgi:hypothetical protein
MTMTAKRPLAASTKARINRELGLTPEAAAIRAADQLGKLEDERNAEALSRLAHLYETRRLEALGYCAVLAAAEHLRTASQAYDKLIVSSAADDLAAELMASGLVVLEPGPGTSASGLREMAAFYARLSRQAREAARCLGGQQG